MKIYGLKNCDTCRKAVKALTDAEFVDVRADGVPADVLAQAYEVLGAALVNTRSTTWRGMDEETRALPVLTLLAQKPTVMKRPLIDRDGEFFLGWTPKVQGALGL
ncbi:ArsC/Spx/MgsR family protein [Cognatishimia sp.]|uniref:ArsC/Spx/MgsR family protein n=1 Tax=Cognatishimia sp. TaxID=2211648 RepID=UPI00351452FA